MLENRGHTEVWKLEKRALKVYERNPLLAVIFAVDFEPILKIGEGHNVPDFQERIRARFPQYSEGQSIEIKIEGPGRTAVKEEKAFEFSATPQVIKVVLSPHRLSRDAREHKSRDVLISDVKLLVDALAETYKPVATRVGLRYVNLIDPHRVATDSGSAVNWPALIASDYMKVPESVLDMDGTYFSHEINSRMARGSMVLRYGMTKRPDTGRDGMHFDIDRFITERVSLEAVPALVEEFASDIYDLFMTAAGTDLLKWMNGSKELGA